MNAKEEEEEIDKKKNETFVGVGRSRCNSHGGRYVSTVRTENEGFVSYVNHPSCNASTFFSAKSTAKGKLTGEKKVDRTLVAVWIDPSHLAMKTPIHPGTICISRRFYKESVRWIDAVETKGGTCDGPIQEDGTDGASTRMFQQSTSRRRIKTERPQKIPKGYDSTGHYRARHGSTHAAASFHLEPRNVFVLSWAKLDCAAIKNQITNLWLGFSRNRPPPFLARENSLTAKSREERYKWTREITRPSFHGQVAPEEKKTKKERTQKAWQVAGNDEKQKIEKDKRRPPFRMTRHSRQRETEYQGTGVLEKKFLVHFRSPERNSIKQMNNKQLFGVGAAGGEKPNDGTTITDYVDVNREQTGCLLMQNNFGKARGHKSAVQQGSGLIPSRTKNEVGGGYHVAK
ncbi:hypothetical protein DAPPUDRAFT_238711 [Daphnia pulex]|uniref:Uncharacterized protein n=1 Tax=Daphnia pulex TaxID=6669 RepID=E9G770_DAPPU|nr:hypothetical protein DAPPUDRAFT_238711 [Daphnia pulex]|eukprot:EFX84695.1 hypothetical protein DAPPUDRAFT_238711 [Daphnia pulex]